MQEQEEAKAKSCGATAREEAEPKSHGDATQKGEKLKSHSAPTAEKMKPESRDAAFLLLPICKLWDESSIIIRLNLLNLL